MSNSVSALNSAVDVDGLVDISEAGLQGMITLRGDLNLSEVVAAVQATGCEMPRQRQIVHAGAVSVAWMSPDELLILCPYTDAPALAEAMQDALEAAHALVANVSDARAMFRVSGPAMRDVIAKLAPVDMARDAFHPGMIRRTRLAQVAAAFYLKDDETCVIVCFRSVAQYVFDVVKAVSRPGSAVGFH